MNDAFTPLVPTEPNATQSAAATGQKTSHVHAHEAPRVTLRRDGDKVTHIEVHCSCGQTIELACVY